MKNSILLLTIFMSCNLFSQQEENSQPLTKKEFYTAVKKDFNSLLGNDEKSINNSITTNFDKNETSVSAKFLIAPNFFNKNDEFKHLVTGKIKVGESNNFLDLGKSKMPLIDLSIKHNWIISKTWYYNKSNGVIENKSNKNNDWTFKKYHWISTEINYINAKYEILDITKPFDEQIYNETYSKASGNISYNYFGKWLKDNDYWNDKTRPHYIFFTANYEIKEGNNINKFNKVEVTDYEQITNNNVIREISTTKTAYQGDYQTFIQHNISSELLLGIQENISLDLFGNIQISDEKSPVYTYGGGLYFLIKNKNEETTVNLGLFIKKEENKDPFLGFKTSIPISL